MTIINNTQRVDLIEGGKRLARVLEALRAKVAPGVTAEELDDLAEQLIRDGGDLLAGADTPAFLGYTPEGARHPTQRRSVSR